MTPNHVMLTDNLYIFVVTTKIQGMKAVDEATTNKAVEFGKTLDEALRNGFNINQPFVGISISPEHRGLNLLQLAIVQKNFLFVFEVLNRGANPTIRTPQGETSLELCFIKHPDDFVASMLLRKIEHCAVELPSFFRDTINTPEQLLEAGRNGGISDLTCQKLKQIQERWKQLVKNNEDLDQAIKTGNLEQLQVLLLQQKDFDTDPDPSAHYDFWNKFESCMKVAHRNPVNQLAIARALLKYKQKNKSDIIIPFDVFAKAVSYNLPAFCKLLIEHGYGVNQVSQGMTALYDAILTHQQEAPFELKLQAEKRENNSDHTEVIRVLLEAGANVACLQKDTALFLATSRGHSDIVALILKFLENKPELKPILNAKNPSGKTALMAAIQGKHSDIVELLITAGADLDIEALHEACKVKSLEMIIWLLNAKAAVNQKDRLGNTPLAYIFIEKPVEKHLRLNADTSTIDSILINTLLTQKAELENLDSHNNSALHLAVKYKKIELIKFLLKLNPNLIDIKNMQGKTPLMLALMHSDEAIDLLLNAGADVEECLRPFNHHELQDYLLNAIKMNSITIAKIIAKKVSYNARLEAMQLADTRNLKELTPYLLDLNFQEHKKFIELQGRTQNSENVDYLNLTLLSRNLANALSSLKPDVITDGILLDIRYFAKCSYFSEVTQNSQEDELALSFKTLHQVLFKNLFEKQKQKKRVLTNQEMFEEIWTLMPIKQVYDKKQRFKENAELQRQAEPVISALLRMPRRFADINYLSVLKEIQAAKEKLEQLIQDNNAINRQQPAKDSKINSWKERLKNNPAKITWLTEQFSAACGLVEQIERQFKRFNENYERIRNQVLELINDGQIDPAKRLLQVLENFLHQESGDPEKIGVIVLNNKLNDILIEINISIKAYEQYNTDDKKLKRTEAEAPKEENLVESKNRQEASRLAQDRKVKAESFLNKREQFLKDTQKLRQAWENASTQAKPKRSESPEQDSVVSKVKKKQFPSPASARPHEGTSHFPSPLVGEGGRRPDEGVNAPGLGLVEFKRKVEEDTVSFTQTPSHRRLRHPQQHTLAAVTELPKQLELREELAQLQQILENLPEPNDSDARKFQCYALLLTCAQTMHTIKSIKGEPLFPQPMAEQFRNAIYHCYTLFGGFAGKEALILEPKKTKTQTASTVTVPAKEVFDQVQDMALKLFQYMKGKLNKTETSPSTGTETERKVQQESDDTPAGEKLKTQTKAIMQAINSPLFNAILRVEIPAKQPSCVAIMFDAYQELQTLKKLDKKSVFWLIRKQASDLLTARVGSLFAYASDHCSELLEGLRNKRQYRQLRVQGNEIRHNDQQNNRHPSKSPDKTVPTGNIPTQVPSPLILGRTHSEEFPKLADPKLQKESTVLSGLGSSDQTLSLLATTNAKGELVIFTQSLHRSYRPDSARSGNESMDVKDQKKSPTKLT